MQTAEVFSPGCMEAPPVAEVFPQLLPFAFHEGVPTGYVGFVAVSGNEFRFSIQVPPGQPLTKAQLHGDKELRKFLKGHEQIVQQRLVQCSDLAHFLSELKDILERLLVSRPAQHSPAPAFYARLISELDELGWTDVHDITSTLSSLKVRLKDAKGRDHDLTLTLPPDWPVSPPTATVDLPETIPIRWQKNSRLSQVVQQFSAALEKYQLLWDQLDDLDRRTWVLEPEHPTRAVTSRRIALGSHCSLQVLLCTAAPLAIPEVRFLGSDAIIAPLRDSLNHNLHKWSADRSVRENLEEVLSTAFPSPNQTKREDFSVECGICYSYRLETQLPDRICDNEKCGRPFHRTCLFEWLRSVPTSRQSFNIVFGTCPNCFSPISVKAV